ncbi:MAG: mandelate racemase/muconate lactonizing enzyme family protein [Deltaproteobacteria bacterium]|nr:mandelate racemase/muconate lactonizing enzyme family protein [Deltaproteobacteria bacterium]
MVPDKDFPHASMKIAAIEALELANIPVTPPLVKSPMKQSATLIQVKTDNGITGISQITGAMPSATLAFIGQELTPFLRGKDPLETERLMHQMLWNFNTRNHSGVWNFAVSAIDVALWDIKGKFFNIPVWRLLGGAQKSVPSYLTYGFRTYSRDELVETAKHFVAQGHKRLKIVVGRLNIRGQMDTSGASGEHREDDPSEDEARVRAVREAVGNDVELMVDANCLMKLDAALRWCKQLEPYNLMWFEEPIVHNDARLLAELRRRTSIPIGAGQRDSFAKLCELTTAHAVDFVQPHVGAVGGFTMGMKVAAVAQAFNLPIGNGDYFDIHLHAAVPNGWRTEVRVPNWLAADTIFKDAPKPVNGWVTLTEKPGLGLELNDEAVKEYKVGN